jgi:ADP-heptose:LPS heptosyltransferase
MWTAEGWIGLLRPLAEEGWGIVLNGHGPAEEALGREVESALASRRENVLNLVGALDFKKMSGVALSCTLALGNDTGPLHLAALGGVPSMGLFNYPATDSALRLLDVPWFREFRAEDYVAGRKSGFPLKKLPAEAVLRAFGALGKEFLPKASAGRGDSAPSPPIGAVRAS